MKRRRKKKKKLRFLFILIIIMCFIFFLYNKKDNFISSENTSVVEDTEITKIKKQNDLNFDIPKKYEELFKKYSKVVENNNNVSKYKKEVYNLFQIIMKDNINEYLDEDYFFDKLSKLNIYVDKSISNDGVGGYYYYDSNIIELDKEGSVQVYHELMHFLDSSINSGYSDYNWFCKGKKYKDLEYERLSDDDMGKCIYLGPYKTDFITEAGAELYSAKYFKKGVVAYFDITTYFTALEYIFGSEKMDEIFLSGNSDADFMTLLLENGISVKDYEDTVQDLSFYTYPYKYLDYTPSRKTLDLLIDLYKKNIKNKIWTNDEEFKYLLRNFMDMGYDAKYEHSKYKSNLDKIAYKSYDDFLKIESDMLKQIPSNIEFNTTPIPAYIKDDTMYLGTKIKINGEDKENTIGYFKYDFNNKKIIEVNYSFIVE